ATARRPRAIPRPAAGGRGGPQASRRRHRAPARRGHPLPPDGADPGPGRALRARDTGRAARPGNAQPGAADGNAGGTPRERLCEGLSGEVEAPPPHGALSPGPAGAAPRQEPGRARDEAAPSTRDWPEEAALVRFLDSMSKVRHGFSHKVPMSCGREVRKLARALIRITPT